MMLTSDEREDLARVVYAAQYPDAADTYDDPELGLERRRARQIAWAAALWLVSARENVQPEEGVK